MNFRRFKLCKSYTTFIVVWIAISLHSEGASTMTNKSHTFVRREMGKIVPATNILKPARVDIRLDERESALSAQVRKSRRRRNVMQMARMLKCMSGCNPLSYRGYGCYCGYMGSGEPVDEIDECCLQHDLCYSLISCPQMIIYFVPYYWHCMNPGAAHCGVPSMPRVAQKCATQLCECDRQFARCVSNYPCPRKKPECNGNSYVMLQNVASNDI